MVDTRQAKETFMHAWMEMVSGRPDYEGCRFFKDVVWTTLSGYFSFECKSLTKARRDKIVLWVVKEVGETPLGKPEEFKETVRGILNRSIKAA